MIRDGHCKRLSWHRDPPKKKIKLHQHPTINTTLVTAHGFFVQRVINSLTRLSEYRTYSYPHTTEKMPKRKLEEVSGPARSSDTRKMSIHGTRLTQMFENGVLMIMRGLKTSRGFERQKLSRREKTAKQQKDEKALARLKEEIETLKVCSYCHCGHADGFAKGLRLKTQLLIFAYRVSITMSHPNDTCSSNLSERSESQKHGHLESSRPSRKSLRMDRRPPPKPIS